MVRDATAALRSAGVRRFSIRTDDFQGYPSNEHVRGEGGARTDGLQAVTQAPSSEVR